ncbi:helicase-related protein [Hymenobacter chitinivorans]|uniref:SNF2 domain-containing protein n=1 Tax=Hymenobacter chitinivorans DSM 11115 TaxID=1121954 RepID=A0A2M9B9J2_9BACT|nr:helicase-related protein [Hymenobacter chitinivorans]PJJ54614.1 SNF2 domain-containing protein [Hymenobacter chitinivorans DSM 11115]
MTKTKFFTNQDGNTLLEKLRGIFAHMPVQQFDALVGFFRASGCYRLRELLADVAEVRILVGINVDKALQKAHAQGLQLGNALRARQQAMDDLVVDIQEAEYTREAEDGIRWFVEGVASGRLQVRAHPSQRLHSKIYIFRPVPFNEHTAASVITGSSNLTEAGLKDNFEFNVELRDYDDVCYATKTFQDLWDESTELLPVDLKQTVATRTYLNDELTPYEIYLKCLIEYFGKSLDEEYGTVADLLPEKFYKLKYQLDAVTDGFRKLRQHHGFFLADVVGLGKTIVGTLIAKRFCQFVRSAVHTPRVLIIAPPALVVNWREATRDFALQRFGAYDILPNGSLHKLPHEAEDYDLIIVDEAHKFRNDTAGAYGQLQRLCKTPTRRKVYGTDALERKRVILISATPLNNRPEDIANLLYLFQDSKQSSLEGVDNLQHFFRQRTDEYEKLKKVSKADMRAGLQRLYTEIRVKVLEQVTVRRTRTDLLGNELYRQDLAQQGIVFPEVGKPIVQLYQLEPGLEALFDETVAALSKPESGTSQTGRLTYNRYRAIANLVGPKKEKYKYAERISNSLEHIMRTMLLKRMDSSFRAFRSSLRRFAAANDAMLKMFADGRIYIAPNLPVTDLVLNDRLDELEQLVLERAELDPSIEVCTPDDFDKDFLPGLQSDKALVWPLLERWEEYRHLDPKLDAFLEAMEPQFFAPDRNPGQKLVIFSEARDTTQYLAEKLAEHSSRRVLVIDSANRERLMPTVRANFDANVKDGERQHNYDILLATEVLAEGVNLHRASSIVNYDTPWNSTRLMQRIGRVNRIGSVAKRVYVYNFFPTAQVNSTIGLEAKAYLKLQAFHEALGEDSEVYSPDEETQSFGIFDKSPDEGQDERLKRLLWLREQFRRDPALLDRLRRLPLRARTGRAHPSLPALAGTTVCYLRTHRRDGFYRCTEPAAGAFPEAAPLLEELSFLEADKLLFATHDERPQPLPPHHHEHVRRAASYFGAAVAQAAAQPLVVQRVAPNERRALDFLADCVLLLMPDAPAAERVPFRAGQLAVASGRFQQLQRELNKLQANLKKVQLTNAERLAAVRRLLSKYPLPDPTEVAPAGAATTAEDGSATLPRIIISESLV